MSKALYPYLWRDVWGNLFPFRRSSVALLMAFGIFWGARGNEWQNISLNQFIYMLFDSIYDKNVLKMQKILECL